MSNQIVSKKIEIKCITCKKVFEVYLYRKNTAKFCSRKCKHISLENQTPWNKGLKGLYFGKILSIPSNCLNCGNIFKLFPSRVGKNKFCSKSCYAQFHRGKPNGRKGIPNPKLSKELHPMWKGGLPKCPNCQEIKGRYSKLCRNCEAKFRIPWNKNTQIINCQKCGINIEVSPNKVGIQKFCSKRCGLLGTKRNLGKRHSLETRELIRKRTPIRRGPENNKWQGGITPLYNQIRNCSKYNEWRKEIFKNDNYTCVMCGNNESGNNESGNLNAHHITPFAQIIKGFKIKTIEDALGCDILWWKSNGVTFCKDCHIKAEQRIKNYWVNGTDAHDCREDSKRKDGWRHSNFTRLPLCLPTMEHEKNSV